jgi:hypothetical protein
MISAATAAVAVLVVPLVHDHGLQYLFAATILMGVIQIIAGFLRLDLLMQYVSRSVITGFVNALAILIFIAQLPELTGVTWHTYAMVAAGLAVIYLFPRLTRAIPSPLVAIILLSLISVWLALPVNTVGDKGELPSTLPFLLIPQVPLTLETLQIILPFSVTMAAVGLLESLLTAQIVDDLTDTPSDKNRETKGQGIANFSHRLLRRHGRLRDDWPIGDQREIRGLDAPLHLCGRRLPAVPDRRAGSLGRADTDAGARCRHDHGVHRHLQLDVDQEPAHPSLAQLGRHGGDGGGGRLDP